MSIPPFNTNMPPVIRVDEVHYHEGSLTAATITLGFTGNPRAGQPFLDFLRQGLRNGDLWEAFGEWYDSGNYEKYEQG